MKKFMIILIVVTSFIIPFIIGYVYSSNMDWNIKNESVKVLEE